MKIRATFVYEWEVKDLSSYGENATLESAVEMTQEQLESGELFVGDLDELAECTSLEVEGVE